MGSSEPCKNLELSPMSLILWKGTSLAAQNLAKTSSCPDVSDVSDVPDSLVRNLMRSSELCKNLELSLLSLIVWEGTSRAAQKPQKP